MPTNDDRLELLLLGRPLIRIGDQAEDLLRELVQAAGLAPESHLDQI